MRKKLNPNNYSDVKPWVIRAISEESRREPNVMWENEPTAEEADQARHKRMRFLRKHANASAKARAVLDRLKGCHEKRRCLSGACPECGRLFQRWFVRQSKRPIAKYLDIPQNELVALSIVPARPIVRLGRLKDNSINDLQRRIKYSLNKIDVDVAVGGVDFSYNEDRDSNFKPFWCPHLYLITYTCERRRLGRDLAQEFSARRAVPRPTKVTSIENSARCRSYALKIQFYRRIGYSKSHTRNGKPGICRNTSGDKLRARERIELFVYLDQIGLAQRILFRGAKPVIRKLRNKKRGYKKLGVRIGLLNEGRRRIKEI